MSAATIRDNAAHATARKAQEIIDSQNKELARLRDIVFQREGTIRELLFVQRLPENEKDLHITGLKRALETIKIIAEEELRRGNSGTWHQVEAEARNALSEVQ